MVVTIKIHLVVSFAPFLVIRGPMILSIFLKQTKAGISSTEASVDLPHVFESVCPKKKARCDSIYEKVSSAVLTNSLRFLKNRLNAPIF